MHIDQTSEFGQRVTRRLQTERIAWLTTVDESGVPQPRPVWFWWDGETFLVYSRPNTHKLHHLENKPQVALNLDGDGQGGDIVVIIGEAAIDTNAPPADQMAEYAAKYEKGFERIGMTAAEFAASYSAPIRIRPLRLRGH